MKSILIILITLFSFTVNANIVTEVVDSTKSAVNKSVEFVDTSSTFKTIYSDIKSGIVGLATALKVTAEHVYTILVKQQVVNSIIYLILGIISIIFIINWIKKYKSNEEWEDYGNPTALGVVRITQIIIGFILLVISLLNIDIIITGLINPEYGAIKEILNFIK